MRLGISLPTLNTPTGDLADYALAAEKAGFDQVWDYEFYRNPYVVLGAVAMKTQKIAIGCGIGTALTRPPFTTANAAADVDELSNGRMMLGLGLGAPEFLASFYGMAPEQFDRPAARLRDYVAAIRASWRFLGNDEAGAEYRGKYYRVTYPQWNPYGPRPLVRKEIPIYLAAMRPKMMELTGEVCNGLVGYLFTPEFIRQRVLPTVAIGCARGGRDIKDFDLVGYVICSINEDRAEAMRVARIQVGIYTGGSDVCDEAVRAAGLEKQQTRLKQALMTKGPGALAETADELVEKFSITGTPDECRGRIKEYEAAGMTSIILHTPYVPPLTMEDSRTAFHNIVKTFAR